MCNKYTAFSEIFYNIFGGGVSTFRNLINNAVSFSRPDDVIEVTLFRRHYEGQDVVCAVVEDSGPGIPDENLDSIFQRF